MNRYRLNIKWLNNINKPKYVIYHTRACNEEEAERNFRLNKTRPCDKYEVFSIEKYN